MMPIQPMSIGFMAGSFPTISETFVLNQVTGLLDRGHTVRPISLGPPREDQPRHDQVEAYSLQELTTVLMRYSKWRRLAMAPLMAGQILRSKPKVLLRALDVTEYGRAAMTCQLLEQVYRFETSGIADSVDCMVCHFGPVGARAVTLRDVGMFQAPIVTFFHAYDLTTPRFQEGDVYKRLFETGELFLAISEHARRLLIGLGCPEERIRIHHMGVDCGRFSCHERRYNGGPVRVLSVGRMVEKKGHLCGLEGVSAAVETGAPVEYTIVGDGDLRPEVESSVSDLGLEEHVRLLGWQPQEAVVQLMYDHDILMMPSMTAANGDEEGVPVVLMEAMATGMPVLASRHAGIPELVRDGESGMLVAEGDSKALGEALVSLAATPEKWPQMGRAARQIVEREYDIEVLNADLEDILWELSECGHRR